MAGVLSKVDLLREEGRLFEVSPRLDFSAFSLDVRIDRLFRHHPTKWKDLEEKRRQAHFLDEDPLAQISSEEIIERYLQEISFDENGIVMIPGSFYLCTTTERITKKDVVVAGEICSRSSWARLGIRLQSADDDLTLHGREFSGFPLCSLISTGAVVKICKGDSPGQLLLDYQGKVPVLRNEVYRFIESGDLELEREGNLLGGSDVFYDQGIKLTMDSLIWVYEQGVLEKGKPMEECFRKVDLRDFSQGYYLKKGTFFISASAETVRIPESCIGHVSEMNHHDPRLAVFSTHANAPYVGPKNVFDGKVTFENIMWGNGIIIAGMSQSRLNLMRLNNPLEQAEESRYKGQDQATLSRV